MTSRLLQAILLYVLFAIPQVQKNTLYGEASIAEREAKSDRLNFENTRYWPDKVNVLVEVTGEMHGNVVKPGKEWTFLRLKDGRCLVDMGHNGIHPIAIADTDFSDRYLDAKDANRKSLRLFEYRYTKMFFDPTSLMGLQLGDLSDYDSFTVLYYTDAFAVAAPQILEFERRFLGSEEGNRSALLIVPLSELSVATEITDYSEMGITSPIIVPYHRKGFLHTVRHESPGPFSYVKVEPNGKILERGELDSPTPGSIRSEQDSSGTLDNYL